jgi:hypothetical protein
MDAWFVGPVILWFIVSFFLVKKKGRQWPDLGWGILGGLILAKVMTGLPNTVYNILDQIWNGIVSIFSTISQGL